MSRIRLALHMLVVAVVLPPYAGLAQEPAADPAIARLAKVHAFRDAVISRDGKRVAWVETGVGGAAPGRVFVAELGVGQARRIAVAEEACTAHTPAWAPDGKRLAFLCDGQSPGQVQVFIAGAGPPQRVTALKGALADPRWSPDGTQIAFLFTDNPPRGIGPTQPGAVETGEIGEKLYYQRLNLVDPATGKVRAVSPADLYVYEYDWSPDGKQAVLIAAHGSGNNNWYIAQLYVLTLATGECQSILKPGMQIAVPRWSPDGASIAFIGGLMSDEGVVGGDVYTIAAAGGKATNHTPDLDASARWLAWDGSSRQIVFTEIRDGGSGIARLDLTPRKKVSGPNSSPSAAPAVDGLELGPDTFLRGVKQLWQGAEAISADVSRDGRTFALVRQSFAQPPEVWAGPLGDWRALTRANRGAAPEWGRAESLHYKSDAFRMQGWLLYPRDFDPARRYPLAVQVHGGPASAAVPRWQGPFSVPAALSRRGYFVFLPNPRGSFGHGERFTRANVKDIGHGDLRDILAGVDDVLRVAPVDRHRIGIGGWSYGGYMTMWAVTQTDRFRAAVAGAGIANWQSYYGQNGIDQWLIPYFGASVYDDPHIYARSSPINFIKRVKTPTLLLVGERDVECPPPQSQEFFHALKTLKVPTKMVVYPGEGHGIVQPDHQRNVLERSVGGTMCTCSRGTRGVDRREAHSTMICPCLACGPGDMMGG